MFNSIRSYFNAKDNDNLKKSIKAFKTEYPKSKYLNMLARYDTGELKSIMSLKEKITEDLKKSMLAQDAFRTETLRSISAEILKMDKSGLDREMNEEEELQLLNKQAKMRKESIDMFKSAGRMDLVERETKQLEIINEYLPNNSHAKKPKR